MEMLSREQVIKRLLRDLEVMYRRLEMMERRSDKMADDIEELLSEIGDELIIIRAVVKKHSLTYQK